MLTKSQIKALALYAQGFSEEDIAIKIGISKRSVRNHLTNANQRMGADDVNQCVSLAIALGILEVDKLGNVKPTRFIL